MKEVSIPSFLRLKANGSGKPKRFKILAYTGGVLRTDNFPDGVVVDLQGLEIPASIPILIDHKATVEATLGCTDNIHNTGKSLEMSGPVTGTSVTATNVILQAEKGHTWQASIGAQVVESQIVAAGETVNVNGQTFVGPIEIARRSILGETSVLPRGADSTTLVNLAASARRFLKGSAVMSFEDYCTSLGLDASTLTPEAAAALQTTFAATQAPAVPPVAAAPVVPASPAVMPTAAAGAAALDIQASLAEGRKQIAAQFRKSAEIQAKAAGHPLIAAKAIEDDWSIEKVELEVIKASMTSGKTRPTSFTKTQNENVSQPKMIEAAVCMSRGIKGTEKTFDDMTLQAAHSQFRGQIGLQQIFLMAAAQSGIGVGVGDRLTRSLMTDILRQVRNAQSAGHGSEIQAAFSTASLPGILSNIANKELLMGWEDTDTAWTEISDVKSCSDFKTVTSYRLLDNMEYEELGPGGRIKHGVIGEETFTRSVKTYAKMFSLTYQMITDDDLGAFDDIRTRLGKGSLRKLKRTIWTAFLSNHTTFWTTARTNYIEGATTNLGTDGVGLAAAVLAYRKRKSPAITGQDDTTRVTLGGRPTKLVVPPELETIADQLYTARNTNSVKAADVNTHANKYRPIVVNELSDSSYGGGYSSTGFYVFGDDEKPVVTSFLNGKQTPTVESADADFDTLGVEFRGYHDFGSSQSEYMAGIKSKGAA